MCVGRGLSIVSVVRPAGTTYDDEHRRHDRLIASLQRRPPIGRLQRAIDAVAELWRPPDHRHSCLGGSVHWRVKPTVEAARIVAAHHGDRRVHVRSAVLTALRHAVPHGHAVAGAIAAGMADPDGLIRIHAARSLADLDLGHVLLAVAAGHLDDPIWLVRWHAARALAVTDLRDRAVGALLASQPRTGCVQLQAWTTALEAFSDRHEVRQRLASLGLAPR